ncbi:MAG TPA: MoxR family ATPase [Anaerolineales bacterium]|nr:MoxR family ATPase [Anaerolineales bacterium]HLF80317.1 MoxR family ATPase [Anaerolineales bacterium]
MGATSILPHETMDGLQSALREQSYLADRGLATVLFLALRLSRPLFLEGEAGVGKTEVAKALSAALGRRLLRLQCYEGLDIHQAVYEWNYTRQMLHIRLLEARGERAQEQDLFGPAYLLRRPLLEAIDNSDPLPPVLLIDEIDRSDEEFEAYLLEVLSDFQISIPEIGTIRALHPPVVVITSNRTREVHDALKRRCLYHWIEYPTLEREYEILTLRVPGLPDRLARQVTAFVQGLRQMELYKIPGIAETLDWAEALMALDREELEPELVEDTLGALLKVQEDLAALRGDRLRQLLAQVEIGG